jgi:hypothetical protein
MIPLAQLLTAPTNAQIRAQMVGWLTGFGIPAGQWRQGGTASTLLTVVANTFGMFAVLITSGISSFFLPTATGPWLVLLAYYVYGVTANPATFASGNVILTNTGGGVYPFAAGSATFLNSTTKQTYTNTAAFTLGALQTLTVAVQATTAGSSGSSPPTGQGATIDTIVTAMAGVNISVAQPIIGLDPDPDPLVRLKCLAALAARSYKGPTGAYYAAVYSATNSVSGQPVNINRVVPVLDPDTGFITVYIASPSGVAASTDVIGCQASVTAIAEPMGITATVVSCTVVSFTQTITVWATGAGTTTTPATIQSEVAAALLAYEQQFPIGGLPKPPSSQGYMYASGIDGVVKGADPLIYAVDGIASDLALSVGQVATVTSTITVQQIP